MLNPTFEIKKEEKKEYPILPKNVYQVELSDITLQDAKGKFAKPGDKVFSFQFTLLGGTDKGESLRGRNIWDNFVPTALYIGKKGKNSLYQIVETYLGRELTPQEEAEGIQGSLLNSFIGKQCKVFVDHKLSGETIFNNITSYMPVESNLTPLTVEEKDNSKVKVKPQEQTIDQRAEEVLAEKDEIQVSQIPF